MNPAYGMVRLDFRLHRFTRHCWVSERARDVWAPRLAQLRSMWSQLLRASATHGLRACAVITVPARELLPTEADLAARGLALRTLDAREEAGELLDERVAIGAPAEVAAAQAAWRRGDLRELGRLLGYPTCCADAYHRIVGAEGRIDPTWPMAFGDRPEPPEDRTIALDGPPATNPLLRWLGVQATPHLPCSPTCAASIELADRLDTLGVALGLAGPLAWRDAMLAWPVEWSALHGIAEIKTPVIKTATTTDASAHRHVVRRAGSTYPEEGLQGLHFPYRRPGPRRLTTLRTDRA